MKNSTSWKPTRVIMNKGEFKINKSYVGYGSLFIYKIQFEKYIPLFQKYLKGKLLDCGCGNIPYYEVYKNQTSDVTCIDWQNSYNYNSFIDYDVDLNKTFPIEDSIYDSVLLSDVLNHIRNPKKLFSEINRVLKDDGHLVLTTPFLYWLNEEPYDFHRYTKYELEKLCSENNFVIVELEEYGGTLDVIFDLVNKILPNKKFIISLYLGIVSLLTKTFIYRRFAKYNHKFPLGYYLVARKCR